MDVSAPCWGALTFFPPAPKLEQELQFYPHQSIVPERSTPLILSLYLVLQEFFKFAM